MDSHWYCFDDSRCSKLEDPSKIITPAAYILFYKRKAAPTLDLTQIGNSPWAKKQLGDVAESVLRLFRNIGKDK